jgi:CheY-like chemotaxis protein
MILRRFDYQVRVAGSAAEAHHVASDAAPSLIITALNLRDMKSLELLQMLRQDPGTAGIPFLITKKPGDVLEARECFYHGVSGCFSLPISIEELYQAVQQVLEKIPRRNIRIRTLLPVQPTKAHHDSLENACTTDLSERGMYVRSMKPAEVRTRLSCQIDLYSRLIEVEATVLYKNRTIKGTYCEPGMGLQFLRIAPNDQKLIRQYIRDEVTRGILPLTM